jgi:hypothetical protein
MTNANPQYTLFLANPGNPVILLGPRISFFGHDGPPTLLTRITSKHYAHPADKTLAQAVTKLPNFTVRKAPPLRQVRVA